MMATLLFLLLLTIIYFDNVYCEFVTYTVTPREASDAIKIKLHNENSKINVNSKGGSWRITNPSKPYSWALHLELLSKSFIFSSKHECSINITIDGIKQSKDGRLFYVFSIGSSFFSFAHDFDGNMVINGKKGMFIYPECDSNLAKISNDKKIGILYNGVHGTKSLRQKLSQTANNEISTQWTQISKNKNGNRFPIYFIITNYYGKRKSLIRFYNNDNIDIKCQYNDEFPMNEALNLLISTDIVSSKSNNKEIFDITKFIISHDCNKGNCDEQKRVKHIKWIDKKHINDAIIPYHKENINIDKNKLSINIDVNLEYLGYSIYGDEYNDNNKYGTIYSLDFNKFDGKKDNIYEAGTCSNRISKIYSNNNNEWNDIRNIDKYLTYPEPTNYWKLKNKKQCGPITYNGYFKWNDLLKCKNSKNKRCNDIKIDITQKWINLTGIFYIDIISGSLSTASRDYFVYNLISKTFVIPISKSVGIKSAIKKHLNLFSITIAAVYKYKEKTDIGYKLILLTESLDYLMLNEAILLSYPLDRISNIEYIGIPINGKNCINGDAILCTQLWEIYIDNISCPPIDLSGIYGLQFNATCNPLVDDDDDDDNDDNEYCDKYINNNDNKVTLSSHLSWIDSICEPQIWIIQFHGELKFYKEITYNKPVEEINNLENIDNDNLNINNNNNHIFDVGIDTVFVSLKIKIPLNEYIISHIKLTNVWICSIDEEQYGKLSISQLRAIGGCLSPNIDHNGPYHILQNFDEHFHSNFKHIDLENIYNDNDVIRFSFIVPRSIKRDKLFIHTQVTLTLIDEGLHSNIYQIPQQNQIRHFGGYINIKQDDKNKIINDMTIFGGYQMDKIIIILIISLVLCVICMNIFVVHNNKKGKNNKRYGQTQSEYDTETTQQSLSINGSVASHRRLYDMIQGLYTSQDENDKNKRKKNIKLKRLKKKKKKKKKEKKEKKEEKQDIKKQNEVIKPFENNPKIKIEANNNNDNNDNNDNNNNDDDKNDNNNKSEVKLSDKPSFDDDDDDGDEVAIDDNDDIEDTTEVESTMELTTEIETDHVINIHSRFKPFTKNDTDFTTDIQTDFTTDIQTLDELTSCTDLSDIDTLKNKKGRIKPKINHNESNKNNINNNDKIIKTEKEIISKISETETNTKIKQKIKPTITPKTQIVIDKKEENTYIKEKDDDDNNNNNNNNDIIQQNKYTYSSETEQEKRERVKLIKQMIEDTEIEDDTEYNTIYSEDYEDDD